MFDKYKKNIEFIPGLPEKLNLDSSKRNLMIIDDLISDVKDSKLVSEIFTRGCHHRNLSVCILTQNLFCQGKESRTISLNAHYIVIFKSPRDSAQVEFLGRQMGVKNLREIYKDATSKPHSYLLLDLRQDTPDELRIRTNVLPGDGPMIVYYKAWS